MRNAGLFPVRIFSASTARRIGPPTGSRRWTLVLWGGQSLTTGYPTTAVTTTAPVGTSNKKVSTGGVVMLDYSGGVASLRNAGSLVSLVEADQVVNAATVGETGMAACCNYLSSLYPGEVFIGASAGVVSTSLSDRVKGTSIYTGMLAIVTAIKALVPAGIGLRVIRFEQSGQTDMFGDFKSIRIQEQIDADTDIRAITGQAESIPLVLMQPDSPSGSSYDACQQMIEVSQDYPTRFSLAGPIYQLGSADVYHRTAAGYRAMGCLAARGLARVNFLNGSYRPILPLTVVRTGTNVRITFAVDSPPLRFDTTNVVEPTGTVKGFEWFDNTATTTVSAVTITDATAGIVDVTLAGTPTGTGKAIRYAHTADATRDTDDPPIATGRRGNLCATSTAVDALGNAINDWCPSFNIAAT